MYLDPIKIQKDHKKRIAHLGLKITDHHIQNIQMPIHQLVKICTPSTKKYEWTVGTIYWQFYRKTNFIKLFCKNEQIDYHWRFSHEQWDTTAKLLLKAVKNI